MEVGAGDVTGSRSGDVFVGRERELGELIAGLHNAMEGRGRLFLIGGEPGIGKSRLADELATRAKEQGVRVLWGGCWEAGGAPTYWPWVQALRAYVRVEIPEILRGQLGAAPRSSRRSCPRYTSCWETCRHRPRPIRRTRGFGSSTRRPPSSVRQGRRSRS